MTFVKLTGVQGEDVFVNPLWVSAVEGVQGGGPLVSMVHSVGGDALIVCGSAAEIVVALSPEPPTVRRMRSVGEQ